jgi:hypothetical protein
VKKVKTIVKKCITIITIFISKNENYTFLQNSSNTISLSIVKGKTQNIHWSIIKEYTSHKMSPKAEIKEAR